MTPPLHTLRHHTRLIAWLGLVALCAQLLAGSISNWHMVQRLASAPTLLDICSPLGTSHSSDDPATDSSGSLAQHCPFCLNNGNPALISGHKLLVVAPVSQALPLLVSTGGILARAPDHRHAPHHAPPFFG